MEEPTPCQKCNEIFDLTGGYESVKWFPKTVICNECHTVESAEIEKDEEIQELRELIEDTEATIKDVRKRAFDLDLNVPYRINTDLIQLKASLNPEEFTWNDLAAAIANLTEEQKARRAFFVIDDSDTQFRVVIGLEAVSEDVYVNTDNEDDCGDLETLKYAHGDDFRIEDYRLCTRKGTAYMFAEF